MKFSEFKEKIIVTRGKEEWERIEYSDELKVYKAPEEKQLKVVKNTGYAIQYINNPTKKMQYYAIRKDPYAIQYIDTPSEEIQLIAVKGDPLAILKINNPTDKVIQEAIKKFDIDDTCNLKYMLRFIENDLKEDKKEETNDTI